jgi:tripartite-type tricarboxylate transporter receptor subunit TctC
VGFVKAGRLRALGVSGPRRLTVLPDVPTIAESGLPGFNATFFLGLLGPAGMPREIVTRLNGEVAKALQRRDTLEWMSAQGMDPVGGSPEECAARIKSEIALFTKVIRDAGVKLN